MNLLKYFDLNRRSKQAKKRSSSRSTEVTQSLRSRWNIADRQSPDRSISQFLTTCWLLATEAEDGQWSIADQLLMYCGLLLGVYCSGMIRGQEFRPALWLAAVTALLIVPIAFEKLAINPNAPWLVRFGLFVQNGVFWDVLLQAIGTNIHR